jgi:hypothetical protein
MLTGYNASYTDRQTFDRVSILYYADVNKFGTKLFGQMASRLEKFGN